HRPPCPSPVPYTTLFRSHVLVAVIVEVAGGRPPGPERLEARRDGRLREFPVAEITVQRVAEEQRVEILALPREHRSLDRDEARGLLVYRRALRREEAAMWH